VSKARKAVKYQVIAQNHTFVPLAFETLGAWEEHCDRIRQRVGKTADIRFGRRERNILFETTVIHCHTARQCDCMPGVTASQFTDTRYTPVTINYNKDTNYGETNVYYFLECRFVYFCILLYFTVRKNILKVELQ